MPTLVVATTNPGKVREIRLATAALSLTLLTLNELPALAEPEETEPTFAGNATLKATYYRGRTNHPTLAEDSGLSIDVLAGRPGVLSARYPGTTYPEKFANLYRELAPFPRPWTARYVSVVALAVDGRPPLVWEGSVEGEISPAPRGSGGFGYDPVFFFPPYGTTLADVGEAEKLAVSHRGQAIRRFAAWLLARPEVLGGPAPRSGAPIHPRG
jgi:XTP/dITP diphosphohydrolase